MAHAAIVVDGQVLNVADVPDTDNAEILLGIAAAYPGAQAVQLEDGQSAAKGWTYADGQFSAPTED